MILSYKEKFFIFIFAVPLLFWNFVSYASFLPYNSSSEFLCKLPNLNKKKIENIKLFKNPQNELLLIENVSANRFAVTDFFKIIINSSDVLIAASNENDGDLENQHKELLSTQIFLYKKVKKNNLVIVKRKWKLPFNYELEANPDKDNKNQMYSSILGSCYDTN